MAKGQFRDVDELRSVMDALFTLLAHDPRIGPALRDADVAQRFEFTDLGAVLDVAPAGPDEAAEPGWYFRLQQRAEHVLATGAPSPGGIGAEEVRALIQAKVDEVRARRPGVFAR